MQRLLVVLTAFLLMLGAVDAHAKRVALVIGNAAYEHAPELTNPVNDAEAIAAALQRLEFDVIKGIDLSRLEFEAKIVEFARAIRGADIALLYYAGHGLQVNGRNYLAPVETELQDEAMLEFETVRLETIMAQMERGRRTNLVFLDACRNNPLARNLARSMGTRAANIGRGLAPIDSGIGTLISFATQPGNVALDGDSSNSPFTEALIRHIETPGDDLAVLLRRVRQEVIDKTNGEQVPWSNSSLTGEVILKQKVTEPDTAVSVRPEKSFEIELAIWNAAKDSGSKAYFEVYLNRFPDGEFADIAKLKIAEFENRGYAAERSAEAMDLAALENPETPVLSKPDIDPKEEKELVRSIQTELNRIGCSVGRADGIWGTRSRKGLSSYSKHGKVELTSFEPSAALLSRLKGQNSRICPLVCGVGFKVLNNKCVRVQQEANVHKNNQSTTRNENAKTITRPDPLEYSREVFGKIYPSANLSKKTKYGVLVCRGGENVYTREPPRCHWE